MGVDTRRPPLPAPTDLSTTDNTSALNTSDDLATNLSRRTDRTSYTIPEDGSPVTITTKRGKDPRDQSQTSLLIEYFEGSRTGDKPSSRPSVRVRVTPSSSRSKSSKATNDRIHIRESGRNRKPSYTKRISLPKNSREQLEITEGSSVSEASSGPPPVEVEVFQEYSDLSQNETSGRHVVLPSDISSMPPDSLLEGPPAIITPRRRRSDRIEAVETSAAVGSLQAPTRSLSQTASREKITSKVMEKLAKDRSSGKSKYEPVSDRPGSRSSRSRSVSKELLVEEAVVSKSRSSKHHDPRASEISTVSSVRSGTSTASINNPKLLNAVEDAIKKLILPEINALKHEQQNLKNQQKFEHITREKSSASRGSPSGERRLSKSSSLPSVNRSRTEIVTDDRGIVAEESGRRRSSRHSSRGSERSYDTAVQDEVSSSRRRSKDKKLRDALAAGAAGVLVGGVASAALKHHHSSSTLDKDGKRKRRSKSRSRSRTASLSESMSEHHREVIPPLPMQSTLDSELTRDSILSAETERQSILTDTHVETPTREVRIHTRGSPVQIVTPGPRSPVSIKDRIDGYEHHRSPGGSAESLKVSSPIRRGIAAGGLAAAAAASLATTKHYANDPMGRDLSPVQSESSLRNFKGEFAQHPRVRSIRSSNSIGSDRRDRGAHSPVSAVSSPSPLLSKKRPEAISLEQGYEILPEGELQAGSPHSYHSRDLRDDGSPLSSKDGRRYTQYTEQSYADYSDGDEPQMTTRNVLGANPEYVHTPIAVESAVASLQEPSMMSIRSSVKSSPGIDHPRSQAESLGIGPGTSPVRLVEPHGSKERWEAIRDRAMAKASHSREGSPLQSETHSIDDRPIAGASYMPGDHDMPALDGWNPDEESELITNPSVLSDKLGGPSYEHSPYEPSTRDLQRDVPDAALLGATGLGLGLAARTPEKTRQFQPTVHDLPEEEDILPGNASPDIRHGGYSQQPGDEGYITEDPAGISPVPHLADRDLDALSEQYTADGDAEEDPFTYKRRPEYASGLSHGMGSPLYDGATGKGVDRIESKDIVALMQHLTVRDSQRTARDAEILITLVRSAAEMRNYFEEMKRYIAEQDKLIMTGVEHSSVRTIQGVLGGPRPQPTPSTRSPRRQASEDSEDLPAKRRNVFRRALKGLSGRDSNDLVRIEDMLMKLLNEVEGLKDTQIPGRPSQTHTQASTLNSYEHLRSAPDPGYEPEGHDGTNSSPAQSGHLSNPSSRHLNGRHSGYDGRRGSDGHRISTVLEGDEEIEDPPSANRGVQLQVKQATPSSGSKRGVSSLQTPPDQTSQFLEPTPRTDKTRSRHKSGGSSIFSGFPRISRWSKTTASSAPDNSAPNSAQKARPYSTASRSGSNLHLDDYDGDDYEMPEHDRLRTTRSMDQGHEVRPPSPLIPAYDSDDPKYQAHRNSLNLQHPQPRPGPSDRHQNYLENQAISFEHPPTPDADQWGSAPALSLNKSRFSGGSSNAPGLSPVYSDGGYSQHSASEENAPPRPPKIRDDGPLVPPKIPVSHPDQYMYGLGSSSGMHIASPLEPIEEVRYSLETDRSSIRHDMTPSPRPTAMQTAQRKITGPRDMPRSGSSGSVSRRRAVQNDSPVSYETYRTSLDSDTF